MKSSICIINICSHKEKKRNVQSGVAAWVKGENEKRRLVSRMKKCYGYNDEYYAP